MPAPALKDEPVSNLDPPSPYAPPVARVDDVADRSANQPADRAVRLGAFIIDGIITSAIVIPVWIWGLDRSLFKPMDLAEALQYMGFAFSVYLVINGAWLARHSQSVGKRLLGIRIVRSDGTRAGLARLFVVRYAANMAVVMIPLVGLLYALIDSLAIFGQQRRCIHDHIADTVVVKV